MTFAEFRLKLIITGVAFVLILAYILLRSLFGTRYLYSVIGREAELVREDELDLQMVRNTSWSKNLDEVTTFSSISIAVVLLAVAYLMESELNQWDELYWRVILFVVGASSVSYTLTIQLYNNALSGMPDVEWTLRQRRIGATLQVIGWYGTLISIMLCIMLVDTWLGIILDALAMVSVMWIYEVKLLEDPEEAPPAGNSVRGRGSAA